ncbi:MAG: BLUF domain-containing protein [Salegentibacter mishustinae]|nr:BLUF domain-containing protein [Salegentibacter mishustinae]
MKSSYTICYTSIANPLKQHEIEDIFEKTYKHNRDFEIKGILLYSNETNRFFQVLEGEKQKVVELYEEKILKDFRHYEIVEVFHRSTSKPIFNQYSTSFNIIKTYDDLNNIREYLNKHKYSKPNSEEVLRLLEPFYIFYS